MKYLAITTILVALSGCASSGGFGPMPADNMSIPYLALQRQVHQHRSNTHEAPLKNYGVPVWKH